MKTLHMYQEKLDPINDIEVINLELILADMESVEKRLDRVTKMVKQKDADAIMEATYFD